MIKRSGRILVTGGAGFIGSHLVRRLLRDGFSVRVLDDYSSGKRANTEELLDDIELIEGSITDLSTTRQAMEGVTYVLHQAAQPSVPRSVAEPLLCHHENATGTLNLLVAAHEAGVERFVYAASCAAYGDSPESPKVETMAVHPQSPYAAGKLAGENYSLAFFHSYGLETVVLRYFNVFGPRQDPLSEYSAVIPRFISKMQEGQEITIFGDGEQSRDFTFIDNVLDANLLALTAEQAAGEVFNIACGEEFTLNHLVAELAEIMGIRPQVRHAPPRDGDVRHSVADINKARQLLNYAPAISFREGLERTVASMQNAR